VLQRGDFGPLCHWQRHLNPPYCESKMAKETEIKLRASR